MPFLKQHISTLSSVYSPIDSEYKFKVRNITNEPILEQAESADVDGNDRASLLSEKFGSEYIPLDTSESAREGQHDYSTQTFGSYVTANDSVPSFTLINNSLLRNDSFSNDNTLQPDNDATPKLDALRVYRDDVDSTPVIGLFPTSSIQAVSPGSQEEVLKKFSRLSLTLISTSNQVTEESQQFQSSFSLNAYQANSKSTSSSRVSAYYQKIHSKPKDDTPNRDRQSVVSTGSYSSIRSLAQSNSTPQTENSPGPLNMDGGLNILFVNETATSNAVQEPNVRDSVASSIEIDSSDDMSVLFVRALHSFDATELQIESENSVCLSFRINDIGFVHTIDDSGWGEVTLVESLERGWIPMNYFTLTVSSGVTPEDDSSESLQAAQYGKYMRPLFHACGKFLLNPISRASTRGKKTFSVKTVNHVRDGVRLLLQETDCLSRRNEIVIKKPVVRTARKSLLSDWYTLMIRANEYKGTSNYDKIEILTLLVLQVIRRAVIFFDVWQKESKDVVKRETEAKLQSDMNSYPLLSYPPSAKLRVTEINGILYSYLALIIGRLDLIEHNTVGCDMLELITHQIILLLRELLFISKTGSDYSLEKPADLDASLDTLLSLVSELVTGVKCLVIQTATEDLGSAVVPHDSSNPTYSYTEEGRLLILVASRMIKAVSITVNSIRKLFVSIGDFKLSSERSYPDYSEMRIDTELFIRKCSVGMAKSHSLKNKDLRTMKSKTPKTVNRYSMFRSGKTGELGITANGFHVMHEVMLVDTDNTNDGFALATKEFQQFMILEEGVNSSDSRAFTIKDELLVDGNGNLLGASFKGLIYTLTNELSPPEYFFVSTFFICFRNFASGLNLLELLISRFDATEEFVSDLDRRDASLEVKLKSRRKLICKMFQIWLESYWLPTSDSSLLLTLTNFFNESVLLKLPIEAMRLIEIAAKLIAKAENSAETQLLTRSITLTKASRKSTWLSSKGSDSSLSSRFSMVDGYELSRINTHSSIASSIKSMTLPMPLGVSGQTSSLSSLLTKGQMAAIEGVVVTFRAILAANWAPAAYSDPKNFVPLNIQKVIPKWYDLCEQNWILSNYKPNLLDFNGLEVAKQLTLIESGIFCAIRPEELLNDNYTAKKAHLNMAVNVRRSLLFTNCLSSYVLESVLQPDISLKSRVNTVKTWLKVAISCLYLRNFNSLAAIITSLQSHLITRVKGIWSDLSDKYLELYEYLSGVIHPEKNYSVYRTKLRSFLLANEYNIPVVPYFSLFLQDLTFVNDGNPNFRKANTFLNQKLINIDKYLKITRVVADIESLQTAYPEPLYTKSRNSILGGSLKLQFNSVDPEEYSIAAVPALQELILLELWKILQLNKKEDDRAWKLSCTIQPRDTSQSN